jgi:hypothetical protein
MSTTATRDWTGFSRKDCLGFDAGDGNLYRYVFNDPTNATDPTGRLLFVQGKVLAENYVKWLEGDKDNLFTKAYETDIGPGLSEVAAHAIRDGNLEGKEHYLILLNTKALGDKEKDTLEKIRNFKTESPNDQAALAALVGADKNIELYWKEEEDGRFTVDGKKVNLKFREVHPLNVVGLEVPGLTKDENSVLQSALKETAARFFDQLAKQNDPNYGRISLLEKCVVALFFPTAFNATAGEIDEICKARIEVLPERFKEPPRKVEGLDLTLDGIARAVRDLKKPEPREPKDLFTDNPLASTILDIAFAGDANAITLPSCLTGAANTLIVTKQRLDIGGFGDRNVPLINSKELELLSHELVHALQIARDGSSDGRKFLADYVTAYITNKEKYKTAHEAYENIPFEKEAFAFEGALRNILRKEETRTKLEKVLTLLADKGGKRGLTTKQALDIISENADSKDLRETFKENYTKAK